MGLFSGLFSNKNDEEYDISDVNSTDIDENLVIFAPHKLLIEISDDLTEIDSEFSQISNNFAYNSTLTKLELDNFLTQLSKKIELLTKDSQDLTNPSYILKTIKQTCADISSYNFQNQPTNYVDFENSGDFLHLSAQIDILESIFSNSLKFENSDKIFNLFRKCKDTYRKLIKNSKTLSVTNTNLSTEIINYTNAVNSVRAKNRLSVDWNGKKPALMNMGNQLNSKRSEFLNQEKEINSQINELYETYSSAHNLFKLHCLEIIDILELNSSILTKNYDNNVKSMTTSIKKLNIAKNKLIDFIDNFSEQEKN